jgi:hypothetical protein
MFIFAVGNLTGKANTVGVACLVVGIALVVAGAVIGLVLNVKNGGSDGTAAVAKSKVENAITKASALKETAKQAAVSTNPEPQTEKSADQAGGEIDGVLKEVAGMIGALPEGLRFSGLLVIFGALLMSVATVQFGGHSIF